MSRYAHEFVPTPLGVLRLVATDDALVAVHFPAHRRAAPFDACDVPAHPVLALAARELCEYFRGERRSFATPLAPVGSDFQRVVWSALGAIPFGERRSYGDVARAVGRASAARAVGAANALNPLSIFVPCHRVVCSGGGLAGYAGGVNAKRWLLDHEAARHQGTARRSINS